MWLWHSAWSGSQFAGNQTAEISDQCPLLHPLFLTVPSPARNSELAEKWVMKTKLKSLCGNSYFEEVCFYLFKALKPVQGFDVNE